MVNKTHNDYLKLAIHLIESSQLIIDTFTTHPPKSTKKIKICPQCGTFHNHRSQFCSIKCTGNHKNLLQNNPSIDLTVTSWCNLGTPILNNITYHKLHCQNPGCRCSFPLLKPSEITHFCIICHKPFISFRNPLICSIDCALSFNTLHKSYFKAQHHTITAKLQSLIEQLTFTSMLVNDAPANSPYISHFPTKLTTKDFLERFPSTTKTHQTKPHISYKTENRLVIQQLILFKEDNHTTPPNSSVYYIPKIHEPVTPLIYTITHNPTPDQPIKGAINYLYRITATKQIDNSCKIQTHPYLGTIIAWRIIFVSPTITLLRNNMRVLTSKLTSFSPHIYQATPDQLTTLINTTSQMHGTSTINMTSTYKNKRLYTPYPEYTPYLPDQAPAFNPLSDSIELLPLFQIKGE